MRSCCSNVRSIDPLGTWKTWKTKTPEQRGDDQGDQDRQTSFGHKPEELAERRRAAVFGIAFGIGAVRSFAGASDGQPGLRPADEMAALLLHFVTPRLDGRGS